jgi:hypothetical protein
VAAFYIHYFPNLLLGCHVLSRSCDLRKHGCLDPLLSRMLMQPTDGRQYMHRQCEQQCTRFLKKQLHEISVHLHSSQVGYSHTNSVDLIYS